MTQAWMEDTGRADWKDSLKFTSSSKNRVIHQGIGRSPYEAMFGRPMRVGIASDLPPDVIPPDMESEQELSEFLNGIRVGPAAATQMSPEPQAGKNVPRD